MKQYYQQPRGLRGVTQQKRDGYFNLVMVKSVAAELCPVTPTLSFNVSYSLEIKGMCAMCRVSPE